MPTARQLQTWPNDDSRWTRARGWALALAIAFLAHSADNPQLAEIGRRTLGAVLAKPARDLG